MPNKPRDTSDGGASGVRPGDADAGDPEGEANQASPAASAESVQCPACQASNTAEACYCGKCGVELGNPNAATLVFDPRELDEERVSGTRGVRASGSLRGRRSAASAGGAGQVPVLTHTLSGQGDALLQLVRRELSDDYDVAFEIGRGGMAIVYRAVERQLRRAVALKVLPPELLLGTGVVERFEREAQMAAALDHPSIIPIYRVGQTASLAYLAMKFVEGRPLDRVIAEQGALPVPVVLLVLQCAASALAFAHTHGIVHRDIKGGNILIDREGRVIVTDFGVARAVDNASMTTTGSVIGTPFFMSPEQCAGKIAAPQSDQYSLGVVAFQMLTGAVPFQADTLAAIMHHHFFTPAPDVSQARSDVPDALRIILNRVLAKDPDRRYATTGEMLEAIERVPLSDADRAAGEAMLRSLADGAALPAVRTSALPPLADTMAVVAAHDAFMRASGRIRRLRRRVGAAAAGAVVVILAAWLALHPTAHVGATPADPLLRTTPAGSSPLPGGRAAGQGAAPVTPTAAPSGAASPVARSGSTAVAPPGAGSGATLAPTQLPPPASTLVTATSTPVPPVPDTATGKLRVRAFPGDALIQIDNETIGQGAVVDRDVLAGERHLHIVAPGYIPFDTMIVLKAGETTRLTPIALKAEP